MQISSLFQQIQYFNVDIDAFFRTYLMTLKSSQIYLEKRISIETYDNRLNTK